MNFESRISTYKSVSGQLESLNDREIEGFLRNAVPIRRGIGGPVSSVLIGNTKVFVKRIHLADLERLEENYRATGNYFDLPLFYQYGVGSAGFGSWRELMAHEMTTKWDLEKTSSNFPILFHARILSRSKREPLAFLNFKTQDEYVSYWNHSSLAMFQWNVKTPQEGS